MKKNCHLASFTWHLWQPEQTRPSAHFPYLKICARFLCFNFYLRSVLNNNLISLCHHCLHAYFIHPAKLAPKWTFNRSKHLLLWTVFYLTNLNWDVFLNKRNLHVLLVLFTYATALHTALLVPWGTAPLHRRLDPTQTGRRAGRRWRRWSTRGARRGRLPVRGQREREVRKPTCWTTLLLSHAPVLTVGQWFEKHWKTLATGICKNINLWK